MFKHVFKIAFIFICIPFLVSSQEEAPLLSITKAELRDQIFFLASDELEGRDTGSEGFAIAALYAVTQFKMSDLEPLVVDKNGKKTFFQSVPFFSYDVGKKSVFSIRSSAGEAQLYHADMMLLFRALFWAKIFSWMRIRFSWVMESTTRKSDGPIMMMWTLRTK